MEGAIEEKAKSKRGGSRKNAGTKPHPMTLTTIKDRRAFFHKLLTEKGDFEAILLSLFKKAKTNPKVAAYVVDQAIGKAIQGIEMTGKDGGAIDFRNQSDDELRKIATSAAGAIGTSQEGVSETAST